VFFIKDIEMNVSQVSKQLLNAKREKNLTFADIGQKLGRDEIWIAAIFYGQATFPDDDERNKFLDILGLNLSSEQMDELRHPPYKGTMIPSFPPTDPLLYRFHEMLLLYGVPMKEVIHEKFGDGIMSAVDFTVKIDKDETNKDAPRVLVNMSGKFLPYKRW
jgi:cyanate lyase